MNMAKNIEIKAKVEDLEKLRKRVERICDGVGEEINQEDIFFRNILGRFKLRILAPDLGQLIFYQRSDQAGPKLSNYLIYDTADPAGLREVIGQAAGVRGTVRKRRWLYWFGRTRIHLDLVESLGAFMELEVVLQPDESRGEGMGAAAELMDLLAIDPDDLIEGAYIDLLEDKQEFLLANG
jgi:predicted adenylyl cyclase CyaB